MKIKFLLGIVLSFSTTFAFCQTDQNGYLSNVNPPSPEASALGKYVEHPVGYYTGTPDIQIPLFTIKCGRISLPINISYHASGVKVDEIASRVGTGWVLNAGGVVTRSVKGMSPDEGANGYFVYSARGNTMPEGADVEPDEHFYNFNGKLGRIYFTDKTTGHTTNFDPIKIDGPYNGNNRFILTTEDGLIYTFSNTETTDIVSFVPYQGGYSYHFTSAWYLTRIDDPVTGKNIQFVYRTDMPAYFTYTQTSSYRDPLFCSLNEGFNSILNEMAIWSNSPKVLQKIIYDNGYIELKADQSRQDLTGDKAYTEINQYLVNGSTFSFLKGYNFSYAFTSNGTGQDNYRMYLESVQEKGTDNSLLNPYLFSYKNRNQVPMRNSVHQDIWGYYNANSSSESQNANYSKVYITANNGKQTYLPFNSNTNRATQIIDGIERSANPSTVDYGTLNKIIYPTKGYTSYTYEVNKFDDADLYTGGGIRIKEITDYSAQGTQLLDKKFSYIGGKLGGAYPQVAFTQPSTPVGSQLLRFTKSQTILGSCEGNYVGYATVTETQSGSSGNNGSKQYFYSQDSNVDGIISLTGTSFACLDFNAIHGESDFPFFEQEDRENRRGALQKEVFTDITGNIIKDITYNYTLLSQPITSIESYRFHHNFQSGSLDGQISGNRDLNAEKMLLTSKVETFYKGTIADRTLEPTIINAIDYTYTTGTYNGAFMRTQVQHTSRGLNVNNGHGELYSTTLYKYPFDYASTASGGVMGKMVNMNYVSPVISEIQTKDQVVATAVKTYYTKGRINNYMVSPYYPTSAVNIVAGQVYQLNVGIPVVKTGTNTAVEPVDPSNPGSLYEKRLEYLDYDSFGNPIKVKHDNQYEIYNWTTYGQLLFNTHSATPTDNGQKTVYTYDSLNRLESVTDPGNKKRTYEYDQYSRLINVRDQDGYIIKSYCYNYAGQQTGCPVPAVATPYVMMTLASSTTDANNHTINTYTFKVYADENLTTLYSVPANLTVKYKISTTVTHSSGTPPPSTTSTTPTIVIPAGSNQVTTAPIDVYSCTGGTNPAMVQNSLVQDNQPKAQQASANGIATPNIIQPGDNVCTSSALLLQSGTGYQVGGIL